MKITENLKQKRERLQAAFNLKSNREKNNLLWQLSQPYIEQKIISEPVKTLQEIFDFQDKSIDARNEVKGYSNITLPKPKRKRKK